MSARVCPGSGKRTRPTGSSSFPEVGCPDCGRYLRPVKLRGFYDEWKIRSHASSRFGETLLPRDADGRCVCGSTAGDEYACEDCGAEVSLTEREIEEADNGAAFDDWNVVHDDTSPQLDGE